MMGRGRALELVALLLGCLAAGTACTGSKGKINPTKDADVPLSDAVMAADGSTTAPDARPDLGTDILATDTRVDDGIVPGDASRTLCTAFSDPCTAFAGAKFKSKAWGTLMFGQQKWVWKYSDAGESGSYVCRDGRIEATSTGGAKHPGEILGSDCDVMNWDIYGSFQLSGARDTNAPEPQP